VPTDSSGLIREIMVTLDGRCVDDALFERALSGDAGWSTAEILRARAEALLTADRSSLDGPLREQARSHTGSEYTQNPCGSEPAREGAIQEAEALLQQSLAIARTQGALAWELRTATSLAQLWQRQSRCREALDLLSPIYQRFTEGYATPDLRKVRLLIDELSEGVHA